MNVMSVELAKELLHGLGIVSEDDLKTAAVAKKFLHLPPSLHLQKAHRQAAKRRCRRKKSNA